MRINTVLLDANQTGKLLNLASGDAMLLFVFLQAGNDITRAAEELHMSPRQLECAESMLRQLGLWAGQKEASFVAGERPAYTEMDVMDALNRDQSFRSLYGEVQRVLGKTLTTEELKILLGFTRYLGLPNEVISVLVSYCRERTRQRGGLRNPSLRSIEKEAYYWAEQGIDTMEQAAGYIRTQHLRTTQLEQLKRTLQLHGRNLTAAEERYAASWLEMGFQLDAIALAYERTCLNVGGLNWAYMNKILVRWHETGLHTAQAVKIGDKKPQVPKGASGELGQAELEAIAKLMQEG